VQLRAILASDGLPLERHRLAAVILDEKAIAALVPERELYGWRLLGAERRRGRDHQGERYETCTRGIVHD
jgi:hypothetical protein